MRRIRGAASTSALAVLLLAPVPEAAAADDLCGKPKATPETLYERLTKSSGDSVAGPGLGPDDGRACASSKGAAS